MAVELEKVIMPIIFSSIQVGLMYYVPVYLLFALNLCI